MDIAIIHSYKLNAYGHKVQMYINKQIRHMNRQVDAYECGNVGEYE